MTVFDLESLITKAKNNNKYKEEETVARIRKERFSSQEVARELPKRTISIKEANSLDMPPEQ